ncbi:hypothetical protein Sgly_2540 [Syntrophobotulus glycolicus DSM 8271]|uniref:Uroporphyrinogen decarboxylase (URO-D) domain-containing protein n=1 Tax=Syntrophobotulus glycolicus (strain DSM 8271 / FlGlyR) TaxID=645991 RepID=F0SW39_SYNGF|nr:uroporphyrinogen decarboxylase family protein [Syntrophobotulus glycolicus]ADY56823.1 hypothetical protein Sgly_2540 [Syntrophobotulus glycolicus DSM 8271]
MNPELTREALSRFCSDEAKNAKEVGGLFYTYQGAPALEARLLGADITPTVSGFGDVIPLINCHEELNRLPCHFLEEKLKNLLDSLNVLAEANNLWLNMMAPYSLLCDVCSPRLPLWLLRYPDEVEAALLSLTEALADYGAKAFDHGVKVISLCDMQALPAVLGEKHHRRFAAKYQVLLLKSLLAEGGRGVVHVCPFTFSPLETYSLAFYHGYPIPGKDYQAAVLERYERGRRVVVGRQCPHIKVTETIYEMSEGVIG